MLKPCGVIKACSPRGSVYSGKLIARAVELYLNGVKPGYIRWYELQSTLEKEFPAEIMQVGQDKPSPETVMEWVRRYPDAPERLKNLRVQQASSNSGMCGVPIYLFNYQPTSAIPAPHVGITSEDINALFSPFLAFLAMALMVRFAWFLSQS